MLRYFGAGNPPIDTSRAVRSATGACHRADFAARVLPRRYDARCRQAGVPGGLAVLANLYARLIWLQPSRIVTGARIYTLKLQVLGLINVPGWLVYEFGRCPGRLDRFQAFLLAAR